MSFFGHIEQQPDEKLRALLAKAPQRPDARGYRTRIIRELERRAGLEPMDLRCGEVLIREFDTVAGPDMAPYRALARSQED